MSKTLNVLTKAEYCALKSLPEDLENLTNLQRRLIRKFLADKHYQRMYPGHVSGSQVSASAGPGSTSTGTNRIRNNTRWKGVEACIHRWLGGRNISKVKTALRQEVDETASESSINPHAHHHRRPNLLYQYREFSGRSY